MGQGKKSVSTIFQWDNLYNLGEFFYIYSGNCKYVTRGRFFFFVSNLGEGGGIYSEEGP